MTRPDGLDSVYANSQTKAACHECLHNNHKSCKGWAIKNKIRCLCEWLDHKDR